ncbi:MAG: ABC transporter transmembrane domain-containing protein, partial [Brevundimonas sp.]
MGDPENLRGLTYPWVAPEPGGTLEVAPGVLWLRLALPMAFFDKAITGQLVSRVTNDTEAVKQLYVQVLFVMLDSVIVVCGALAAMAWLNWRLALVVMVLLPAVFLIVWLYQRWSAPSV